MRAAILHAMPGWSVAELMALPWDEFVAEWGEARFLLEGPAEDEK
jgi:hypothetical protein